MPYIDPTPADIKADFPQFAAVDDAVIQRVIDRNVQWVDESWFETDYTWARELLTAHFLTLSGQGTGQDAETAVSGVSRFKSGTLDVTFTSAADTAGDAPAPWNGTRYGIEFYYLLRKNKGGPRVVGGGCGGIAGQATDVPWAWRTAGFGL